MANQTFFVWRSLGLGIGYQLLQIDLESQSVVAAWPVSDECPTVSGTVEKPSNLRGDEAAAYKAAVKKSGKEIAPFGFEAQTVAVESPAHVAPVGYEISLRCKGSGVYKTYAAVVEGSDSDYRFRRSFLEETKIEANEKQYHLTREAIYETQDARGNRQYFRLADGQRQDLTLAEVEAIFPAIPKTDAQYDSDESQLADSEERLNQIESSREKG